MLAIGIDALALMVLLKTISDDDIELDTSIAIALVASIGTKLLALGLGPLMGIAGIAVASVIAAISLGVAVSAMFGVEIKRSFLIGAIFMVVHVCVGLAFQFMLRS